MELIKKTIKNILFFTIILLITYYLIFRNQDMNHISNIISDVNLLYVLLAFIFMFLYLLTEAINIKIILKSLNNEVSLIKTLKFTFIGFFFSSITPAASGGQPMEIYYMSKDKIRPSNGTLALLINLCGYQIAVITFGVISAIIMREVFTSALLFWFIIGTFFSSCALGAIIIGLFNEKLARKLVNLLIRIMKFLKIKNIESKEEKTNEELIQYRQSSKYIRKNKRKFIEAILRSFIQMFFYHTIIFFTYKAFNLQSISFIKIFMLEAILHCAASSIPLPGAIGISENIFLKIFKGAFSKKMIRGALLVHRFTSFYLYVFISLIVVILNEIRIKKHD